MIHNKRIILLNKQIFDKISVSQIAYKSTAVPSTATTNDKNLVSYELIPGPKRKPFFGNLLDFKQFGGKYDYMHFREFQNKLQAEYGDMVRFDILKQKGIFLFHPEHIKQVFKVDGLFPNRPLVDPMLHLQNKLGIPPSLLNSMGDRWRKLRTASNPVLARPQSIHNYLKPQNEVGNEFIDYVNGQFGNEKKLSLTAFDQTLRLLAFEYLTEVVLNKRLKCIDEKTRAPNTDEFVRVIEEFFVTLGLLLFSSPLWRYYPTKDWKKFEKLGLYIYGTVTKFIQEAQDEMAKDPEKSKDTILGQFMARQEKSKLELKDIVSIMTDLLIAGVDTTSTSLYHLMYELALNPNVQQKLYEEIDTVMKGDRVLTEDHLEKMKYMKNVFKESSRLHSVVPSNARILNEDIVLENYLIPKGTMMNLCNSYITQSERYFKNPTKFIPERWDREDTEIHPYATLAFGFGARMCIGRRLAEQEVYITLIKLVQNYRMEYYESPPNLRTGLLATPDKPLNITLFKR